MKCEKCGFENDDSFMFCNQCGESLRPMTEKTDDPPARAVCRNCGAVYPAGVKFCGKCGSQMKPESAPIAADPADCAPIIRVDSAAAAVKPAAPAAAPAPKQGRPNYKIEGDRITCLLCGEGKMPRNRRVCWSCGATFTNNSTDPKLYADDPSAIPASPKAPVKTGGSGGPSLPERPGYSIRDGMLTCLSCGASNQPVSSTFCRRCGKSFLRSDSSEAVTRRPASSGPSAPYKAKTTESKKHEYTFQEYGVLTQATTALVLSIFTTIALFLPTVEYREKSYAFSSLEEHAVLYLLAVVAMEIVFIGYVAGGELRHRGCAVVGIIGEVVKMSLIICTLLVGVERTYDWWTGRVSTQRKSSLNALGWISLIAAFIAFILMFNILTAARRAANDYKYDLLKSSRNKK